ncbi:MAG: MopE-related protein [Myxococcota bacterium]|nr:MopE-related protein [Myxococcota bacterium]
MRKLITLFMLVPFLLCCLSLTAWAEDKKEDETEDGEIIMGPAYEPEIIGYEGSEKNKDYKPKTDSEGSNWYFDPEEIDVTTGMSDTGTNFQGARILTGGVDVVVGGMAVQGTFGDEDNSEYYMNWQGSTLYFGVNSMSTTNTVDGIVEFYWFESSIPRGSDFYVMQIKVKSSPDVWGNWRVAMEPSFVDEYIFFWQDIQPAQMLDVYMEDGGDHGSLRWDFSVPFDTYEWQPEKTMQIRESYGAGYEIKAGANASAEAEGQVQFKEGGIVADLSGGADIQSKGYINESFKVQSQYTVTLYHWQMLVQSGGDEIHYKTVILPNSVDHEADKDSAYHEYFVVLQSTRGVPVHVEDIHIGASFRHVIPFWFDGAEDLTVSIGDIWITPPTGICIPGDIAPEGTCMQMGVCGIVPPRCIDNQWECPIVDAFEEEELSCDGLDNDCDGVTDEDLDRACSTDCGDGVQKCQFGAFQLCSAPQPEPEICDDGLDNDCNGWIDDGEACEAELVEDPETEDPTEETTEDPTEVEVEDPTEEDVQDPNGGPVVGDPNEDPNKDPEDEITTTGSGADDYYGNSGGTIDVPSSDDGAGAGCSGGADNTWPVVALLVGLLATVLRRREGLL